MREGDLVGGKYRVLRLLGEGGMGTVYEARHEGLAAPVALKFLHAELAEKAAIASRFLQEARVSAAIQSPYVTRVTDVDISADGIPYLVMELLQGRTLFECLSSEGPMSHQLAIDIAVQVLVGLQAAHALRIVHRDLKPENVFLCDGPEGMLVKLLDFGIAKVKASSHGLSEIKGLTRPGALIGTPGYMAPEQMFTAESVDHRADLYSVGVMLFEMLSGSLPVPGESPEAIMTELGAGRVLTLSTLVPDLPQGLVHAVHRALNIDQRHRFASAADFRAELVPFAEQLSVAGERALRVSSPAIAPQARRATPPTHTSEGLGLIEATARSATGGEVNLAATAPSVDGLSKTEGPVASVARTAFDPRLAEPNPPRTTPRPGDAPYLRPALPSPGPQPVFQVSHVRSNPGPAPAPPARPVLLAGISRGAWVALVAITLGVFGTVWLVVAANMEGQQRRAFTAPLPEESPMRVVRPQNGETTALRPEVESPTPYVDLVDAGADRADEDGSQAGTNVRDAGTDARPPTIVIPTRLPRLPRGIPTRIPRELPEIPGLGLPRGRLQPARD